MRYILEVEGGDHQEALEKVVDIGARHARSRYEHTADEVPVGLREGVPDKGIRSRELKILGTLELGHHWLLPGEIETQPFRGHMVNLHLSAPHHLLQRRNGRTHEGLEVTGAVDIVPAGSSAYWRMEAESEGMNMLLEDRFIQRVAAEAGVDAKETEILALFSAREPQIERIGLSLLSQMKTGGLLGGDLYAESLANVLALHLLRHHSSLGRRSKRKTEREGGLSKRAFGRAIDYINDNLSRKVTLAELAGVAHVSTYHFARSFKTKTGLSPHQYVIRRRVERAKTLLADSDLTIVEVAGAVGFANQSHLAYHVRRQLGVSPKTLCRGASP